MNSEGSSARCLPFPAIAERREVGLWEEGGGGVEEGVGLEEEVERNTEAIDEKGFVIAGEED